MMMPAAIDMLPSPAERAGMREGTWLTLEEDVGSESRHVLDSHTHARWLRKTHSRTKPLTMPFDKALHDLLGQPFGPYLEETILSEKCRFIASKRLQLRDFQLAYNNEPTG
jgi:hypothetical protein